MIVADTSVWIEFLRGHPSFDTLLGQLLHAGEILGVECVFGELLQVAQSARERGVIQGYWESIPKADERGLWTEAGECSGAGNFHARGVGLIDASILTATRRAEAKIWTLDRKLMDIFEPDEIFRPA